MSVTKTLIAAVPTSEDGKVVSWYIDFKYEKGTKGEADYHSNVFHRIIESVKKKPSQTITRFTPKPEAEWTKADIIAICPVSQWDEAFEGQYVSVITNPDKKQSANPNFAIPD